ncbi:MAG: RNA polymerase sigma-54 factor [Candidatus Marinimicrobia bacterium]|nr:RNA polymerase sigma-54 factor [Candidatus Neomarinimicrobiota bacterium]|tara:strand:- start:2537 stop:3901 length:1365 start_codon:yes stop_codon:yes gene_type:complete
MTKLAQTLEQRQKLSPQQILQTILLQMNSVDLEVRIMAELEENPALELTDGEQSEEESSTEESSDEMDWEEILNSDEDDERLKGRSQRSSDMPDEPIRAVRSPVEKLLDQIALFDLSSEERTIAKTIVWNIDEQGYLSIDMELIADRLECDVANVESVLRTVQRLEPAGIGARDLQECLSVQLEVGDEHGLAKKIVDQYFDHFANRRFERIEDELHCTREELLEAFEVISHLNPKPGDGAPTTKADYIVPDISVDEVDDKLLVSVNDSDLPDIRLSPVYENILKTQNGNNKEVKKFLREKVERAKWFVQAIQQRQITMTKVMEAIMKRQDFFFSGETSKLRPMILKDIADDIGMDISTVSRVTRGKYVQTPWGVFELKYFFSEGMMTDSGEEVSTRLVKNLLKKIVEGEDKEHPISDDGLAEILKEKGYPLARRTVAKYRGQMKIPVARLRRAI